MTCLSMQAYITPQVKEEFKKIRKAYTECKQMQFNVEAYSYEAPADNTPALISKGEVKRLGKNYYSSFLDYELMISGEEAVLADHAKKELEYYQFKRSKPLLKEKEFEANIDTLMNFSDSIVQRRNTKEGQLHFSLYSEGGMIALTELYVDAQTHFISRIIYYYGPSTEDYQIEVNRVDVFYKNIKTSGVKEEFFKVDKYVRRQGGKTLAAERFKGYQVANRN